MTKKFPSMGRELLGKEGDEYIDDGMRRIMR
jgi:hypothetical protein